MPFCSPHVMTYNLPVSAEKLSDVARYLGCDVYRLGAQEAAVPGIKEVCRLLLEVSVPASLTEQGVKVEDIPEMAISTDSSLH